MKKIVILFECILLLPSYETTFDCCFILKFPKSFCEVLCNNLANNMLELQLPTSSFAYANPYFRLPLPVTNQIYQINPLLQHISPGHTISPQISRNYPSRSLQQSHISSISQHEILSGEQSRPAVPIKSSGITSSYNKQQSNFAKVKNVKDAELAAFLDAIEEFHNQTAQIHEPIKPIPISSLIITSDSRCNNNKLKIIMLENIGRDLNTSKKLIQLATEAQFGGHFNVICSYNNFSFLTNTKLFCQATKGDVSCYAYRVLL
ncbi:Ground-like domain family protein [Acanthocheilonema viteae]